MVEDDIPLEAAPKDYQIKTTEILKAFKDLERVIINEFKNNSEGLEASNKGGYFKDLEAKESTYQKELQKKEANLDEVKKENGLTLLRKNALIDRLEAENSSLKE